MCKSIPDDLTQKPYCTHCGAGANQLVFDAYAVWNIEKQCFEVSDIFDKGHHCAGCGVEWRAEQ